MKKSNKALPVLSGALALALLAACGGAPAPSAAPVQSAAPAAAPAAGAHKTVGIVQLIDNGAFTDMRDGFIDRIRALGYTEDQLTIDYKEAGGDVATVNSICQSMVDDKVDLLVTIATPPTQAAVNLASDIPTLFISVSDPVAAGVLTDMAHPDKNATGTSNAVPVDEIFKLAATLTPQVKTFGLLYGTNEANSVSTIAKAKTYLDSVGAAYTEQTVTGSGEVQQAAQTLADTCDAIFVPNDSVIQAAMPQVAQVGTDAGIPVYGSSAVMVNSGALATVSVSDAQIGAMSADMADRYFKGTAIADIPATTLDAFQTVINSAAAEALGLTIPEGGDVVVVGG